MFKSFELFVKIVMNFLGNELCLKNLFITFYLCRFCINLVFGYIF